MNFFKLSSIFTLLFLATFAQRFYRYSNNGTQNEIIYGMEMGDNNLASDGTNVEQDGNDVKLIRYGEVKLELSTNMLTFEYCSKPGFQRCMNKIVTVCYDSVNPNSDLRFGCGSNQCEFKAGISPGLQGSTFLWFMNLYPTKIIDGVKTCATATMKSPTAFMKSSADTALNTPLASCDPLFIDGNIVKLFVKEASEDCFLIVKNAKLWTPTTPSPTTLAAAADSAKEETSNATTIWIIVGVGLGFLLLIIVGLGLWYYCTRMQKKHGDGKKGKKIIIPESRKTNVEAAVATKEKPLDDKKEALIPPEETKDTKEKKETVEAPKPKKKEKKGGQKPSKEVTTENEKVETVDPKKKASIEPTVDNPTADASIVQQPNKQHFPTVSVPKTQILPAPKSCGSRGDSHSSKKGSLSGRHEVGMQIMVESPPDSVKRHCFGSIDDATKDKLDKFYPSGSSTRVFEKREILLFCCSRVSIMFKGIEILVDMAIEALAERDVKFDEKDNIVEMSTEAEKYLRQKSTPEITRAFAFGQIFRHLIDSRADIYDTYSIPLLFVIVLQRRYSVLNRRKAFIWIRRQLPIIYTEFTLKERKKLAYPINAIEEIHKLDPEGFKDVAGFHTESGMEEDETQASKTHASEKNRKKESGGKKKKSKKR